MSDKLLSTKLLVEKYEKRIAEKRIAQLEAELSESEYQLTIAEQESIVAENKCAELEVENKRLKEQLAINVDFVKQYQAENWRLTDKIADLEATLGNAIEEIRTQIEINNKLRIENKRLQENAQAEIDRVTQQSYKVMKKYERLKDAGKEYRDALQKPEHSNDVIGVQKNQKRLIAAQRAFYKSLEDE